MNYIYERILLNQLAIMEGFRVALPLGNRRGVEDSINQTERVLRRMEEVVKKQRYNQQPSTIDMLDVSIRDTSKTVNGHVLYVKGDKDIPAAIMDQNGDIALGQCKVCGAAEIELETPCKGVQHIQV